MLLEFLVGQYKHNNFLVVLEQNEQLSKSKQSNIPNLLLGWQGNTVICYNRCFKTIKKAEKYYYREAFYFLNKDQTINIPSNDEILSGDSEDEDEEVFNEPSLTLTSKDKGKGKAIVEGKGKEVICKEIEEKAVKVSAIDALLDSLDLDEEIGCDFEKAIYNVLAEKSEVFMQTSFFLSFLFGSDFMVLEGKHECKGGRMQQGNFHV